MDVAIASKRPLKPLPAKQCQTNNHHVLLHRWGSLLTPPEEFELTRGVFGPDGQPRLASWYNRSAAPVSRMLETLNLNMKGLRRACRKPSWRSNLDVQSRFVLLLA